MPHVGMIVVVIAVVGIMGVEITGVRKAGIRIVGAPQFTQYNIEHIYAYWFLKMCRPVCNICSL